MAPLAEGKEEEVLITGSMQDIEGKFMFQLNPAVQLFPIVCATTPGNKQRKVAASTDASLPDILPLPPRIIPCNLETLPFPPWLLAQAIPGAQLLLPGPRETRSAVFSLPSSSLPA